MKFIDVDRFRDELQKLINIAESKKDEGYFDETHATENHAVITALWCVLGALDSSILVAINPNGEKAYDALHRKSKPLEFGDYVSIEQKRYGAPNEFFTYKVIGADGLSNHYRETPVDAREPDEVSGGGMHPVVRVICCGVVEDKVEVFRVSDVVRSTADWSDTPRDLTKSEMGL